MNLLFPFLIVWAIVAFIMYKGVVELKLFAESLPILMLLIVLLVIRGICFAGGGERMKGLELRSRRPVSG